MSIYSCGDGYDPTGNPFVPISDRAKAEEAAKRDCELGGVRPAVSAIPVTKEADMEGKDGVEKTPAGTLSLREQLEIKEAEVNGLRRERDDLQTELTGCQLELGSAQSENKNLQASLRDLPVLQRRSADLLASYERNRVIRDVLTDVTNTCNLLNGSIDQKNAEIAKLQQELAHLRGPSLWQRAKGRLKSLCQPASRPSAIRTNLSDGLRGIGWGLGLVWAFLKFTLWSLPKTVLRFALWDLPLGIFDSAYYMPETLRKIAFGPRTKRVWIGLGFYAVVAAVGLGLYTGHVQHWAQAFIWKYPRYYGKVVWFAASNWSTIYTVLASLVASLIASNLWSLARIIGRWQRKKAVAKLAKGQFEVRVGDGRSTEEVVAAGGYKGGGDRDINSANFPMGKVDPALVTIEFIECDEINAAFVTPEEVVAIAKTRGLEPPTYQEALHFGEQYLGKFSDGVRNTFLHRPHLVANGEGRVIELQNDGVYNWAYFAKVGAVAAEAGLVWGWRRSAKVRFAFVRRRVPIASAAVGGIPMLLEFGGAVSAVSMPAPVPVPAQPIVSQPKARSTDFADEEEASNYTYPAGFKVKSLAEQVGILQRLFPELDCVEEDPVSGLPSGAEGYFAIPKWQRLASTYGQAVEKVLAAIKTQRQGKFYNWHENKLDSRYLRQSISSAAAWDKLASKSQEDVDILFVAAQLGLRHRGRSVRRARAVMNAGEFGLGAFAVGIILLTHPECLVVYGNLWLDCAGDEYSPDGNNKFSLAPIFYFCDGGVGFRAHGVADASAGFGSASGFLPQ